MMAAGEEAETGLAAAADEGDGAATEVEGEEEATGAYFSGMGWVAAVVVGVDAAAAATTGVLLLTAGAGVGSLGPQ